MLNVTEEKQRLTSDGLPGSKQQSPLKEQDYLGMSGVSSPELKGSTTNMVDLRHLQLATDLRLGTRLGDSDTSLSLGFQQLGTVAQPCKATKRVHCEAFGGVKHCSTRASRSKNPPAARASVVGWPPVQSFRKQSLAVSAQQQPTKQAEHTRQAGVCSTCFVKVHMDGVSIGRKVDINLLDSYERLSGSLEEKFSNQICGNSCPSCQGCDWPCPSDVKLSGSEYVLTYEDKDGDLMLVGDVPWNMFKAGVKRLRIMRGSEAIGLVK